MNRLKNILQIEGIRCYVAAHDDDYGSHLSGKLSHNIDESDVLIVILTRNSNRSSTVGQEIGYAKKADKRIIPLVDHGTSIPVMLQGIEYVPFTLTSLDLAAKRISRFINSMKTNRDDDTIQDNSTEETIMIESGGYKTYSTDLEGRHILFGEINSDLPINVYVVDDRNLKLLEAGKGFESHYDAERVKRCKINFQSPNAGSWNVVIENEEDDHDEFEDAEVDVFLEVK